MFMTFLRLNFDPRHPSAESARFFDPDSTIYDGRVAGPQDLARPLTAEIMRKEAKELAKRRYSLSEFNCDLVNISAQQYPSISCLSCICLYYRYSKFVLCRQVVALVAWATLRSYNV